MAALDMLRSAADFQNMQSQSRSRAHRLLMLRYRRNGLDRTRYGISTGRRVGPAVVRNKVRRRLRTILRRLDPSIQTAEGVLPPTPWRATSVWCRDGDGWSQIHAHWAIQKTA